MGVKIMSRHAQSSRTSLTRRYSHRLALGVAVLAPIAMASAVVAAPPDIGFGPNARLVSDEELGDMRGRYIEPEAVNFFGIELASSWQTADGLVLTATLQFEADFDNGQPQSTPVVLASYQHDQNGIDDPGLEIGGLTAEFTAQGLSTVDGAVQANQIGGDDNNVANLLRIRVGDFDADSAGFSDYGTPITQSVVKNFPDGSGIEFTVEANSIGVAIQGPTSQGQSQDNLVAQSINGSVANQIAQQVQLMGDANAVYNTLDVVIGVDQLQTTQSAVENAMSVMKGWGF
jgi:hypothetical protein